MIDFTYDIEVYPNCFQIGLHNSVSDKTLVYEISERRNDFSKIRKAVGIIGKREQRMVGFNNIGYDYPVLHQLLMHGTEAMPASRLCNIAYQKSCKIIESDHFNRFAHRVWESEWLADQLDLYLIHHFDNVARATSLKVLEFNMMADSIQELPFPPGTVLTPDQLGKLEEYNRHDIRQTVAFKKLSGEKIKFREEMSAEYGRNFMNHNDTKIGKDYFIMELEDRLGANACFTWDSGRKKPRQTIRKNIDIKNVIFPYVEFERPEFNAVLDWLKAQSITQTKGVFTEIPEESLGDVMLYCNPKKKKGNIKNLNCIIDGFQFDFGTGGIHGSVNNTMTEACEDYALIDIDVASYYPNLSIQNNLYPEHLSEQFCDIYLDVYNRRKTFPKKQYPTQNAIMKLALNGVYGDSNSQYSPFYDPQYTMSITVNGQLLLCMLAEKLMKGCTLLQINTDGMTVHIKRERIKWLKNVCARWEKLTRLELEYANYSAIWIRDVNNYLAEYENGDLKNKGAYEYDYEKDDNWNKNFSARVVPKIAEQVLTKGGDIEHLVKNHTIDYDFFLRTKVPRSSHLILRDPLLQEDIETIQNVSRYYVSKGGDAMVKVMPPLPKNPEKWREIGVNKSEVVTICNDTTELDRSQVDYDYYVQEVRDLVDIFGEAA